MTHLLGASIPFTPFPVPVTPPLPDIQDSPQVTVCLNIEWMTYLIGAAMALTAQSTWASDDENTVNITVRRAYNLIDVLAQFELCPVPIQFQVNPTYPQNWQYSLNGGVSWLDGPDTATHFTPQFIAESGAPSGYELTVNGDHSSGDIPLMTATDPNAVVTDPTSDLRNEITVSSGVEGIVIQGLAQVGVRLQNNGIAAEFQKIPGLGLAADAVTQIAQGSGYLFDLLRIVTAI